jgi:hypothetical protein
MQWLIRGINRVANRFKDPQRIANTVPTEVKAMLAMLEKTQENELSCDETHALIGEYAEMTLKGEDAVQLLSMVHHHLELCPDCREEYEALASILKAQIS